MALTIYELKTCSTGRKAVKWLNENNIEHTAVAIRDTPPTEPMLIKRPLVVNDKGVLVGFKEAEWQHLLG